LKSTVTATVLAGTGNVVTAQTARKSATDLVHVGNSGVRVTRLAFGTGTHGGHLLREMGQENVTRLIRYAYERGVRFFETSEDYGGGLMPQMLGTALKGLPRDSYRLMTKYNVRRSGEPTARIDRFRKDLNSDQIDILLLHGQRSPTWPEDTRRIQDAFSEAKSKKIISAHGASIHGLQALAGCPGNQWLDVALLRLNHAGVRMDTPDLRETDARGDVNQVVARAKTIRGQGTGVLGMKLIGEGQFTKPEDREASIRFVMGLGVVDAVTIGFLTTGEIDEALDHITRALNA
jgi:hypothetical protein